jgi:hypothetical protein
LKGIEVDFVRRRLEELIKSIDLELTKTEVRLTAIAEKFGLNSWRKLEVLFKEGWTIQKLISLGLSIAT